MRILADYHHATLFQSLQLLFCRRLGVELYRPVGMEWYENGYWDVYPHPATAKQFLDVAEEDSCLPISKEDDGIYWIEGPEEDTDHLGITLDRFADLEFDVVISSIPQHIGPYNNLIATLQPGAKHIFQVGNSWGHQPDVGNFLVSAAPFSVPQEANVCFYHQEFDLGIFDYGAPVPERSIFSYVHYMRSPGLFAEYADRLSETFHFRAFGSGMGDTLNGSKTIADKMRSSTFTWHFKPEGDGYGHVIHNTYAVGRPALIWGSHYEGKLARALFEDGVTCLDLEGGSPRANVERILHFSEPERHERMCEAAHSRFCEVVDFDEDERRVREFLDRLQ